MLEYQIGTKSKAFALHAFCILSAYFIKNIYLSSCLKVVWKLSVPEYILTFQTGEYCLSTALGRRGYSHTLNQLRTLNVFVETFFSPDSFGLASFFLSFVFWIRIFYRINILTFQARTTSLQNKYSYLNAAKRSINASSTPLIILINESRLRLHS